MSKVAVLGMGAMGSRMAKALLEAGYSVAVWNIAESACDPLVELGATKAGSPRTAAEGAEFVIAMVWDDAASASVWLDEQTGALRGMSSGAIALECATLTVEHERNLLRACEQAGIEFVSAPMAGSLPEADARTLVFTVGATPQTFDRVRPLLQAMGKKINHAGGPLDGISEKLIINGKLGIEYAHAAEMVALDMAMRNDTERRLAIRESAPTFSARGIREARFMLAGDETVRVKVDQLIKDISNQITQMETYGVPCPMHRAALQVFEQARDAGYGGQDAVTVMTMHRKQTVPPKQGGAQIELGAKAA